MLDAATEDDALLRQRLEERVVVDAREAGGLEVPIRRPAGPARGERLLPLQRLLEVGRKLHVVLHVEADAVGADQRLLDGALLEELEEAAVGDGHRRRGGDEALDQDQDRQRDRDVGEREPEGATVQRRTTLLHRHAPSVGTRRALGKPSQRSATTTRCGTMGSSCSMRPGNPARGASHRTRRR